MAKWFHQRHDRAGSLVNPLTPNAPHLVKLPCIRQSKITK